MGNADQDHGLVIVLCKPCQKVTIATGTGTEKILTDPICKAIIDSVMIPKFKDGDFFGGTKQGVLKIIEKWD